MRENRGKAKQYTTINGRTVVVKDAFVYSNKGALSRVSRLDEANEIFQDSRRLTRLNC